MISANVKLNLKVNLFIKQICFGQHHLWSRKEINSLPIQESNATAIEAIWRDFMNF